MDYETNSRLMKLAQLGAAQGASVPDILRRIADCRDTEGIPLFNIEIIFVVRNAFGLPSETISSMRAWHEFEGEKGWSDQKLEKELRPYVTQWLDKHQGTLEDE